MRKVPKIQGVVMAAVIALIAVSWVSVGSIPVVAQEVTAVTTLIKPNIQWFGPVAISPNDTFQFNYSNLGAEPVMFEWAVSNSITGELVCSNIGKPVRIEAGKGVQYLYSQPIIDGVEKPSCPGGTRGDLEEGESYFDANLRHGLIAWSFVQHLTLRGQKLAVDLPTLEIFNSMIMPDGTRAMSFGRTMVLVQANPTAPADYQLRLLGK